METPVRAEACQGREPAMMNLDVTKEELELIRMLLHREELTTRIEIHHARMSFEYRDYLKGREKEIQQLLENVNRLLPTGT
ncbi:MAG: hypothetical protein KBC76_10080 [Deltaproteobacteria bacterium]|nr:hypothetical protein [Deltaproteobacteria bacterium]